MIFFNVMGPDRNTEGTVLQQWIQLINFGTNPNATNGSDFFLWSNMVVADPNGINTQSTGCGSKYDTIFAGRGYLKSKAKLDCTNPFLIAPSFTYNSALISTNETVP